MAHTYRVGIHACGFVLLPDPLKSGDSIIPRKLVHSPLRC